MKTQKYFILLVAGLAFTLIVSSGCRKRPGLVTPLPNAAVGQPGGELPPGGILPGDKYAGGAGQTTSEPTAYPAGQGHPGWTEDASMFQSETVYFDYDSSAIKSGEKSKIETVAGFLKSNPSAAVRVEGNCDERGTEEYNRSLGERRALAVREYLIQSGITPDRVDTLSYGEDKPADSGHGEAAWKKNRRGEFVVLTPPTR